MRKIWNEWDSRRIHANNKIDELSKKGPTYMEEFKKFTKEECINITILFDEFIKFLFGVPEFEFEKATVNMTKCARFLDAVKHALPEKFDGKFITTTVEQVRKY